MATHHATFASLYRQIIHLSRKLPDVAKRDAAVRAARENFKRNWKEMDEVALSRFEAETQSRLSFLKMMTPTTIHRTARGEGKQQIQRFMYKDGERFAYDGSGKLPDKARYSNWTGSNMDPDSVAKHQNLLNRAGFRDNAQAKGFF
mmetsp:Transcript_35436/g.47847  ORF Transcript_35436/g.47847 Transcript_35436/m.47847 type:complete len:146 (-) Transcript_35436:433-870(-)